MGIRFIELIRGPAMASLTGARGTRKFLTEISPRWRGGAPHQVTPPSDPPTGSSPFLVSISASSIRPPSSIP